MIGQPLELVARPVSSHYSPRGDPRRAPSKSPTRSGPATSGIERVAERRRWLRRTLKAEHALIPRLKRRAGQLLCVNPSPALPLPGSIRRKSSRVTSCPCERGCARPHGTGKPLQIAVDGVPGTTGGDADLCRDLSVGHHASSFNYEFTSAFGGIADHARTCRWLNPVAKTSGHQPDF